LDEKERKEEGGRDWRGWGVERKVNPYSQAKILATALRTELLVHIGEGKGMGGKGRERKRKRMK